MHQSENVMTREQLASEVVQKVQESPVILFMKGTPEQPYCGFSARTVAALDAAQASFSYVNVLADPRIREVLSEYSNWPTVPQLFVGGTLVGGCDIVEEMAASGELSELLASTTG